VQPWERHFVVRRWGIPDKDPYTPASVAAPMLDPHRLLDAQLLSPARRTRRQKSRPAARTND
jgi:hypothetical protein